jgi:predicted MPP superfamily phosphohydrolase
LKKIITPLRHHRIDLIILTGDYISSPSNLNAGIQFLNRLCAQLHPPLGFYGVFGNHDTTGFRQSARELPITWLNNSARLLPGFPLEILGLASDRASSPDSISIVEALDSALPKPSPSTPATPKPSHLRLMLSHTPDCLPSASDLGVHLMFAGHTHGGQWRLPRTRAFVNATDLPLKLTAGILRHRHTLCLVSRGLGETFLPLRLFCPRQLPIYTLRRGPLIGRPTDQIENIMPW